MFAFTLRDDIDNFTVFDVSGALRERGWLVPAYTFPEKRTDLAALRVVVKQGFTHDMADMLVDDLNRQLPRLRAAAASGPRQLDRVELPPLEERRRDVPLARLLGLSDTRSRTCSTSRSTR